MSFRQFLLVIRARWKAVILVLLICLGTALALSLLLPNQYTASASVVVDYKGADLVSGLLFPAQLMPGYIATQVDIIQSHRVSVQVVRSLGLANNTEAKQQFLEDTGGVGSLEDWYADLILKKLDVKPARDSSVIDINYSATDPRFAALVANAFADAYQKVNLELKVEPSRQAAVWFDDQLSTLRSNLEKAQSNLNTYQRAKGIVATDDRLDVENSRLSELSSQLVAAQAAAVDSGTRLKQLEEFMARGADPATLPDVLANQLVQSMKGQLTQSEARLEQISSQLGNNHPEVQKLRADIASQRLKIKEEIANVAAGIKNIQRNAEHREADLRQAVAVQKAKLLQFNQSRDELAVLMKEVESAQHSFEAASQRHMQTNLEGQANQTNIAVLNKAIPPFSPSFPRFWLNCAVGTVVGLMFGVGLALIRELFDRRVRSEEDFLALFDFPLLALVDRTRGSKRTILLGRARRWRARPMLKAG